MIENLNIRPERPNDIRAIHKVTALAFADMPYSDGSEPRIIDALRRDGDLSISLVAEINSELIGQITFSPVEVQGGENWYGLGPVSVHPDQQSGGIGAALIKEGIEAIKALGAKGCVLVGDPDYYGRFGFRGDSGVTYMGLDPKFVQQLPFEGEPISGEIKYAPGFGA